MAYDGYLFSKCMLKYFKKAYMIYHGYIPYQNTKTFFWQNYFKEAHVPKIFNNL